MPMKNLFIRIFGLDDLVIFSVLGKSIQGFGMLALLFSVGLKLSEVERGFYFSFTSFAALQVFFELGIGIVIMQHAARYVVSLGGDLHSTPLNLNIVGFNDIKGLYQFNLLWSSLAGFALFVIVLPIGLTFFNSIPDANNISWRSEWFLLILAISLYLPLSSQLSFYEGSGYLLGVLKLRMYSSLIAYSLTILSLFMGASLYALSILFLLQSIVAMGWIFFTKKQIFKSLINNFLKWQDFISWFKRLLPMQWRIAISWMCGYIAFQIATPLTLSFFGAKEAGEIGLFLNITNMFVAFLGAWMTTKIPIFSKLVEQKAYPSLDILFFSTIKKLFFVYLLISTFIYFFSNFYLNFAEMQFMTLLGVCVFLIIAFLTIISYAQAVYLRSFLKELFLPSSLAYALIIILLLPILLPKFMLNGILLAFLSASFVSTLMTTFIFYRFKKNLKYS